MFNIVIFLGFFDFIIIGYVDLIKCVLLFYDKIIVVIGVNSQKKYFFFFEERLEWFWEVFVDEFKVEVGYFFGFMVYYVCQIGVWYLLCGLWNVLDFDYEKMIF